MESHTDELSAASHQALTRHAGLETQEPTGSCADMNSPLSDMGPSSVTNWKYLTHPEPHSMEKDDIEMKTPTPSDNMAQSQDTK